MKIATWNINGIRARLDTALTWVKDAAPDIVCMQEIKCEDLSFPSEMFEELGYNVAVHGQKGFNGVALLSKLRLEDIARGLPGNDADDHARFIDAVVSVSWGALRVVSLYLPNGNPIGTEKFAYKLAWMDRLRDHARELLAEERPVILAGDWNVIPTDSPDDVFSARAMAHDALMQPESRNAFRRILNQGWTDAIRARYPEGAVYTFWDYQAGCWQRDAGFRIDHLLLSPQAADRLLDAGVDKEYRGREKASDHAPTWVEIEVEP
jgi:exodeoxyribonuclease-3